MSDQNGHRGGPPQDNSQESAYPPPPGEEDERERPRQPPYPQAPPVSLPPIQHHPSEQYAPRYPDPRAQANYTTSPPSANGYGPPPGGFAPLPSLPPVQAGPPPEGRYGVEPRAGGYPYDSRGSSFPGPPPPPDYHYNYPPRPSSGSPYANAAYEYGRPQPSPAQAAPRQRTSIACSYCRRRKIRCSGYGTSDGVCSNCRKTGNKCVFQPVSSGGSTAFVPVSAVPGGVPPGTPLYGAFGQPLAPGAPPGSGGALPPPASGAPYPGPQGHPPEGYGPQSPRSSYYPPPPEDVNGRRRPNEEDHASRLPPPVYGDPDPHRRSPASPGHSHPSNTPPQHYDYPANAPGFDLPSRDRTSTPRRDSPNSPQQGGNGNGPMSLHSLIDPAQPPPRPPPSSDSNRDMDQSMLSRLNRRT